GRDLEEPRAERTRRQTRDTEPQNDAAAGQGQPVAYDQPTHRAALCAERHSNSQLAAAATDRVTEHAVDADGSKRERNERVTANHEQREALLRDPRSDDVTEHPWPVQHECRIDRGELMANIR